MYPHRGVFNLSEGCPLIGVIFFLGAMALGGRGFGSGRRRRLPALRVGGPGGGLRPHTPGPGTQVPAEWDGRNGTAGMGRPEWDGRYGTAGMGRPGEGYPKGPSKQKEKENKQKRSVNKRETRK